MISFIRSFFNSKIGLFLTFAFLGLIAIAFAASDATGGAFGGLVKSSAIAKVDDYEINEALLERATRNAFREVQQRNPELTLSEFIQAGGMEDVLDRLIDTYTIGAYGERVGLTAGRRLIDAEIRRIPAFRGIDGQFDETVYRQALRGQDGLTEATLRENLGRQLINEQLLIPATFALNPPRRQALPYVAVELEGRTGRIALIPSLAFLSDKEPTAKEVQDFFKKHAALYRRPESRVIKYATFTSDRFRDKITVSDAEVQARYKQRAAEFAPSEQRRMDQIIAPTREAAEALARRVSDGAGMENVAASAGLSVTDLGEINKAQTAKQTSAAVADAAFAAKQGSVAKVAQSDLGWHVVKVYNVRELPGRSLEQVRPLIENEIEREKLRTELEAFTEQLDDAFSDGVSLEEIAEAQKLEIKTTPKLLADGTVVGKGDFAPTPNTSLILPVAFSLAADSPPELVELQQGREYGIVTVEKINPSAPPPLAEIRDQVVRDFKADRGSRVAKTNAQKVVKAMEGGQDLAKALELVKVDLPPGERIGVTRRQIQQSGQRVPPPIALMFSMAEDSVKMLEAPAKSGWFIVRLDKIAPGKPAADSPTVTNAARELGPIVSGELSQQFLLAAREVVTIERNKDALAKLKARLLGQDR